MSAAAVISASPAGSKCRRAMNPNYWPRLSMRLRGQRSSIRPAIELIRSWQTSTLIVKNGAVSAQEIILQTILQRTQFRPGYYPGISPQEVNRFNILQQPYLYQAATALLGAEGEAFIEDYKFNIEPATDDRPYFFHFFKWQTLPEIVPLLGQRRHVFAGKRLSIADSRIAAGDAASLVLIALPLRLWKNTLGIKPESGVIGVSWCYFFCLGLAFLFIEIAFIQKFILILHHPIYAITVVLCTFLISAGAGSQFSKDDAILQSRWFDHAAGSRHYLAQCGLYPWFRSLHRLLAGKRRFKPLAVFDTADRAAGFFHGHAVSDGAGQTGSNDPALIPWAWGINGCASVISAILATLIAMQFGFTFLIFLAIALYWLAAWCFKSLTVSA